MSSSKHPGKKDKGKAMQKAEDYQLQVPTKNQFLPLANFPPLPYKYRCNQSSTFFKPK